MEHYTKGVVVKKENPIVMTTQGGVEHMRVTNGSKIRNLLGYALKKIRDEKIRQMVWSGNGEAISKVLSCTEIMKSRVKGLHQITKLDYLEIEEYWEPTLEGLERLKVKRDVPVISVLLSKDEPNTSDPGYQAPGVAEPFCGAMSTSSSPNPFDKKAVMDRQRMPPPGVRKQKKRKHAQNNETNSHSAAKSCSSLSTKNTETSMET